MKMINKILVAIDGSSSAIHAANYAIKFAREIDAQIEIVYVIRYAIGNIDAGVLPIEIEEHEKENAIELINNIKKEYPEINIQDFETIGYPAEEINKLIQKWEADLLVLGHHTHHFLDYLLLGSVENKLLKHLRIPLLIIPED
jgi:nucleotide-binding universal stress UspA family protein